MKKTLIALLMAASGCSGPNWKEPAMDQAPIMIEEAPREKPKAAKKETPASSAETKDYSTIELSVAYQFGNSIAERTFNGYIRLMEKDQGDKPLTEYEQMRIAYKVNKDGNISSNDISNVIASYAKEKGIKEVKTPVVAVNEDNLKRVYTETISVATEEVGNELRNMLMEKNNAEKAEIAEAVRSVYGGQNPLPIGPKQLQQIKAYLKK